MSIIYNLLIKLINTYIFLSSFLNEKSKKIQKGRKNTFKYVDENINTSKKNILIHVSSVGEFEQAKPIIDKLKSFKEFKIIVSHFSSSLEEILKDDKTIDFSFYLPSDVKSHMDLLIKKINPLIIIIIKYEFWKNLILTSNEKKIPIISVSTILRKKQFYLPFYSSYLLDILKKFDLILVQNRESVKILKNKKINNVKMVGDTRFDRVLKIYKESKNYPLVEQFKKNKKIVIIGSSWKSDIDILKKEILRDFTETKYIIAPHEISDENIKYIENTFINDTIKYSELPQKIIKKRILIIDNFGLLSSLYKYSDVAYIGGGFRGALHNTLEAAVWDIPIIYGNHRNNRKFNEVLILEKNKIGFPIRSGNEFKLLINRIVKYGDIGKGGNKLIKNFSGATSKISNEILRLIK
ncbi:MAG: 3-deoxy-D-manno-octulosonic acid transferase [Cytophagales bacterium]|nr:MAG: 3-deoxy-D-manno-octulosonic acid transferase [Rhodothermaeota bacterium MED-G18]|tara:strand:+ start:162 stop:1388 length:1227 start_codon:yes stop_codon:yes gene_type:complete